MSTSSRWTALFTIFLRQDFSTYKKNAAWGAQGRYSFVGAWPALEVIAKEQEVTVINHSTHQRHVSQEADPLGVPERLGLDWRPVPAEGLPAEFTGGWVGYCGYDTVRYTYASECLSHGHHTT